jgi:murein DD-endopeptidase MepM/ murein hydrolase activator NlpD
VEVEYEWHILNVTMASRSFADVLNDRMEEGQRQHHALLMQSRGLRQIVLSPFDFYWPPFISSHYGWRINPISGGKQLHRGIDIARPTGTPILAATSGTVTFAGDMGGYGLVVFIDNGEGIVTVYAHCDTLLVSTNQTVEAGDVIATVGSTGDSTGPHLHFEIIVDGIHRNPAFFAFTNTF